MMATQNSTLRRLTIFSALTIGGLYVLYSAGVAIMPSSKSGGWNMRTRGIAIAAEEPASRPATQPTEPAMPPSLKSKAVIWGSKSGQVFNEKNADQSPPGTTPLTFTTQPTTQADTDLIEREVIMSSSKSMPVFPPGRATRATITAPPVIMLPSTQPSTQPTTLPTSMLQYREFKPEIATPSEISSDMSIELVQAMDRYDRTQGLIPKRDYPTITVFDFSRTDSNAPKIEQQREITVALVSCAGVIKPIKIFTK